MSISAPKISHADPAETTRLIADFVRGFSIEATRPTAADLAALKLAAPTTTQVYLAAVPTRPLSELVAFATSVRASEFEPIPHLAVRNIASSTELDDLLAQLSSKARVRRLLVITGDSD